ncbi:unnamed protein product, partial [Meganyctiphanes norvegica]
MSVKAAGAGEGNAEGDMLEDELAQVDKVLDDALKTVRKKSHLVFNLTSKEWLKHFDRFRESMEEVERRYQCVMVAAVQTVDSVAQGLQVLNVFHPLAARKSLFAVFYVMIDHILNLFDRDFENVEKEYVFRSMSVGREGFSYSNMAKWATDTRKKLESEVNLLRNQAWLPYYPRLDSIYTRWYRTEILLKGVVDNMYLAWTSSLEAHPVRRLLEPILRWRPGTIQLLQDNFDVQLYKNLEESSAWVALGFEVPDSLQHIFNEYEAYTKLKLEVLACAEQFNEFVCGMSRDEAQLFESQVQLAVKAYYPGLSTINWSLRHQIPSFMDKCKRVVGKIKTEVNYYLNVNNQLSGILREVKDLVMYTKEEGTLYEGEGFIEDLLRQTDGIVTKVRTIALNVEEVLDSLFKKLINKTFPKSVEAWISYVQRVDELFLECQKEILRKSLLAFEGMLMGSRSCPVEQLAPVFKVRVSLTENKIVCEPSVDVLLTVLKSLKDNLTQNFKRVPCLLRRHALSKSKEHDHVAYLEDEVCSRLQKKLSSEFQLQVNNLQKKLESWQQYRDLWEVDKEEFFNHYLMNASKVQIFQTDIQSFEKKCKEIESTDDHIKVSTFYVICLDLKSQLIELCHSWVTEFQDNLFKIASSRLSSLYNYTHDVNKLINTEPQDISGLLKLSGDCQYARGRLMVYKNQFKPVSEQFQVLKDHRYSLPANVDEKLGNLVGIFTEIEEKLKNKITDVGAQLDNHRKVYSDKADVVMEKVAKVKKDFKELLPTRLGKNADEALEAITYLKEILDEVSDSLSINKHLELLSLSTVEFPEIHGFQQNLIAAEMMWKVLMEWEITWEKWSAFLVWDVDIISLQDVLVTFVQKIRAVQPDGQSDWEIKEDLLSRVEYCKLMVPLITNLQSAELKPHHWQEIKDMVKMDFDENGPDFSFGYIQSINLASYTKELTNILIYSAEEAKICHEISQIQMRGSQITLSMKPVVCMDISVVQSTTEASNTIATLNMNLQLMSASPHAKPYLKDIEELRKSFTIMIDYLEDIESLQRKWAMWEPFFNVDDVRNHLAHATEIFDDLNFRWQQISATMKTEQFLRSIALHDELHDEVKVMSSEFDKFPDHIFSYLQDRKEAFPRFWFLSNDDLINAISTVISAEYSVPFLNKIFTNIAKIKEEKGPTGSPEIVGIFSGEGEFLELNSYVTVMGSFDSWLKKVIYGIEVTLKENLKQCRSCMKSPNVKFDEILKLWPLQMSVLAFFLLWTSEVTRAVAKFKGIMKSDQLQVLKKRLRDNMARLDGILTGGMAKLLREKVRLFYLAVLQVRDFLGAILENKKFPSCDNDMQIRYLHDKDTDDVIFQLGTFEMIYSWEYQGLWPMAVISPMTTRSLFSIARVISNGSAIGLVGTQGCGKTETVKTAARLLGRHLLSVSCTSSLTSAHLLQKLFGCFQTNSWLLLESAHCLNIDVIPVFEEILKVIFAAQTSTVRKNVKLGRSHIRNSTVVEGVQLSVSPLASVILEYERDHISTRKQLEILRQRCRPVVLFGPDINVMIESILIVEGFKEAQLLAQKLNQAIVSLSTALPRQRKYQLGIKSASFIIQNAKDIMKRQPEVDEMDTIPLSLKEYLKPQLKVEDAPIFTEVFEMIFPDFDAGITQNDILQEALIKEMKKEKLIVKESYTEKMLQLYESLTRSQMVLVLGPPGCGKSTALTVLGKACNTLNSIGQSDYKKTNIEIISPLAINSMSLYGPEKGIVGKAKEGYLSSKIRKLHKCSSGSEKWIIIEGPCHYTWLQTLFQHFHLRKKMYISNNMQLIPIPNNLKMIMEMSGTALNLSPSEVTNCSILYFQEAPNLWEDILQSWLGSISQAKMSRAMQYLISKNLPSFTNIMIADKGRMQHMIMKAKSFTALVDSFLVKWNANLDIEELIQSVTPAFIFSIIWSFGSDLNDDQVAQYEEVVTRMIEDVPEEGNIYDYFVDPVSGRFCSWNNLKESFQSLNLQNPMTSSIIVPNERIMKYTRVTEILMQNGVAVLLKGDAGSGKSTIINTLSQSSDENRQIDIMNYTAATTPSQFQEMIRNNLIKQSRKVLSSKKDKLHLLIDDIHCCQGTEHLHQILDTMKYTMKHKQIYNEDLRYFLQIPEVCLMCTYQSSDFQSRGLKLHQIDEHIQKYWPGTLHVLSLPAYESSELTNIFSILFDGNLGHLDQDVKSLKGVIADAVVFLYQRMGEITKKACPSHIANLHHPMQILAMLRGLQLGDEQTLDRDNFLKHFMHECYRVFYDSMVVPAEKFNELMNEVMMEYFCIPLKQIVSKPEVLILSRLGNKENLYTEKTDDELKMAILDVCINLSGSTFTGTFAIYHSLIHHIIRLLRILGQDSIIKSETTSVLEKIGGHLIITGPGGCGKKTCVQLVAHLANYKIYRIITILEDENVESNIMDDLYLGKKLLILIDWNTLERMSDLTFLNKLLIKSQKDATLLKLTENMKIGLIAPTLSEAKEILNFLPAMTNYYSIDTFQSWNSSELQEIARQLLKEKLLNKLSEESLHPFAEMLANVHITISEMNTEKFKVLKNPSSKFFTFIELVLKLYVEMYQDIIQGEERFKISIIKYEDTKQRVTELSHQLQEQRTQVTQIQQTCGNIVLKMRNIRSEQARMEQELQKKTAHLKREKEESERIRKVISRDLDQPKEEMKAIHRRLDRIPKEELDTLRNLSRPSPQVELVFEAILIVLGVDPTWNETKKQLSNGLDFITAVRRVSVEDANEKILKRIQEFIDMDELQTENVEQESKTAETFLNWLSTFAKYARVYKDYHPLKIQADVIDKDILKTEESMSNYREALMGIAVQHTVLVTQLQEKEHLLEVAEDEMKNLEGRIQLAQKVMTQLGEDKVVWEESLALSSLKLRNTFGDSVLAAAFLTYLGPYEHNERKSAIESLQKSMRESNIFYTEDRDILELLATLELRVKWHADGLPLDDYSLENAAIISNSPLPQLVLDPNCVLTNWILKWDESVEVDLSKTTYLEEIFECAKTGKTCVIMQDELFLKRSFLQILKMEKTEKNESGKVFLKLGERTVEYNKMFRIIIITRNQSFTIDNKIQSMVNVVNILNHKSGLEKLLTMHLVMHNQPDLIETFRRQESDSLIRENQLLEQESNIRDIMAKFDDDVLGEDTLMEMLQVACSKAGDAKRKCLDLQKSLKTVTDSFQEFMQTGSLMAQIFLLVQSFSKFQISLVMSFERFTSLILSQIPPKRTGSWGRLLECNTLMFMIQILYRHF